MLHFLGTIDEDVERRFAPYLRATQAEHGGWPLYRGGDFDVSASVKAYFALKAIGDPVDAPHMARARAAILAHGGAERSNVFTRIMLALWGEVPWHAVPVMPIEMVLLPHWFPFHLDKVSYWSRTVVMPLLVLMTKRPRAKNPRGISIGELFAQPVDRIRDWIRPSTPSAVGALFVALDRIVRAVEPYFPKGRRQRAVDAAVAWVTERLNGEDGLGAIFPAMVNALMMYDCLGYPPDHPHYTAARVALERLVVRDGEEFDYCQPCLSPVWDTVLAGHALMEVGDVPAPRLRRAFDWLRTKQVLDIAGDWAVLRPGLRPGGWAFQYENPHYPDVDDTAAVGLALDRFDGALYREAVGRAAEWIIGMQSKGGGWGSFDADNTHFALNHIPFADHGALLDPPTADVSARCLGFLVQIGHRPEHPAVAAALGFLKRAQEPDGSWFGRWGTNYIYGTWSVLVALNAAGIDPAAPEIRRAVAWLLARQHADGGWGESGDSYWDDAPRGEAPYSTASQTAWALLGLMAAGEAAHPAVERGVAFLIDSQRADGSWDEAWYTAVGFPRVFYLRYHGYRRYFPLWALARHRRLKQANAPRVAFGI